MLLQMLRVDKGLARVLVGYLTILPLSLLACHIFLPSMHVWFDLDLTKVIAALGGLIIMALFVPLFLIARFSFGYIVGLFFFSAVAGFVWISHFSPLYYDARIARFSAVVCLLTLLLPLLFVRFKPPPVQLSKERLDTILLALLIISFLVVSADASYGVAFDAPNSSARENLIRPSLLNYLTGIVTAAILPFCFAWFATQRRWLLCAAAAALLLAFYPVTVNKTILFSPAWLLFVFLLFRSTRPRLAAALCLLVPVVFGLVTLPVLFELNPNSPLLILGSINLRLLAVPSIALDHYSEFFTQHPLTHFCQISVLQRVIKCPYNHELGVIFARASIGNLNASLLATKGIASVGPSVAPISALICGLILSIGNIASARLRPDLIAISSSISVQVLLNLPLTTALLTGGTATLFALWFITPRDAEAFHKSKRIISPDEIGRDGEDSQKAGSFGPSES
jgi:hypothetical protein